MSGGGFPRRGGGIRSLEVTNVKTEKSEKPTEAPPALCIVLPDGKKARLDPALVEREKLKAGMLSPFTRLPIMADDPPAAG